jgi:putative membrane protein
MAYSPVDPEQMILRDHLAHERTVLANERTLLAYVRTAIAILAGGGALVEFFEGMALLRTLGMILLVAGMLVLGFGIRRFVVVSRGLRRICHRPAPPRKTDAAG